MKTTLILLFILSMSTVALQAQSAIYVCGNTGALGYSWAGSTSGMDRLHLEMTALEECRNNGGTACELLQFMNCNNCYVAVVIGMGDTYVDTTVYASYVSADEAEAKARQGYRDANNVNPDYARIYSWYVPE